MVGQRRCRFVHEQKPRIGGKATANRHDLPFGNRELTDDGVERQVRAEARQDFRGSCAHGLAAYGRERRAELLVDGDVFPHAEVRKQREVLIDDLDAQLLRLIGRQVIEGRAVDDDAAARVGSIDAGDDLDERGFAGAVLSDQAMHFAGIHRPVDAVEGDRSAETLADVLEFEKRRAGGIESVMRFVWLARPS